jgi:hypothetical protein
MTKAQWRVEEGLHLSDDLEDPIERGMPEEHGQLRKTLTNLKELADESRRHGGQPSTDLLEQIETTAQRIAEDFDPKGRPRWEAPGRRRAQSRINQLLKTARVKLAKHNEALALHLKDSIKTEGAFYSYRPDREIDWDL